MGNAARPILVVDDNAATRYATSRVLRAQGFEVVEAESGTQAIQMAQNTPGLILLDVHLPDINGFDVCRQIRQIRKCATVPIIHISATYVNDSDKVAGLEAGADAYLVHPIEPPVLVATVQAFLRARRAEEAKRESEAKFHAIFDQSNAYSGILSIEGVLVEVNQSALQRCGYAREDVLGKPFWDTAWWRGSLPVKKRIHQGYAACLEGRVFVDEFSYWMADGTERICDCILSPVYDASGEMVFVAFNATDITPRKRAEDENARLYQSLKDVDRKKDEFLATLAHELRNPLAPIRNGLQILRLEHPEKSVPEVISVMDRQLTHLVRLVDDLLDVSRITRGKVDLQMQPVSLRSILESALETSMPLIDEKGHTLGAELPPADMILNADHVRLSQVFSNLLNNAAKYTPENGRVSLSTFREDDTVEVRVTDNGVGIPAERLGEVFEIFAQVEANMDKAAGGLGLGLALAKSLVDLHGGTIRAESTPGKGTTVFVCLPLADDAIASEPVEMEKEASQSGPLHIMVVDDSLDNSRMLATLIGLAGHEVQVANSGTEAIELVDTFKPHLAFVDIGLPDMSGRDVAVALRQKFGENIKLVALTGYGREEDKQKSLAAGFDLHLTKPAPIAELEDLMQQVALKKV